MTRQHERHLAASADNEEKLKMRIQTPLIVLVGLFGVGFGLWNAPPVMARWKPEYAKADPKVQAWYRSQRNAQGQWCCDESDGHPYHGSYTLNKDGSVTLDLAGGKKHTIPAYMVITGPNPTGHAVWWYLESGSNRTDFCFAPGTLT